jgi:aspartyl/asparaginyl beta-hydroxylase (cupin superfamily)
VRLADRNKLPIKKYNHLLQAYNKFGQACKPIPKTLTLNKRLTFKEAEDDTTIKTVWTKELSMKTISPIRQPSHIFRLQTGQIKT